MAETSAGDWDERLLLRGAGTPDGGAVAPRETAAATPLNQPQPLAGSPHRRWPLAAMRGASRPLAAQAVRAAADAIALEAARGTPFLLVPVFLAAGAYAYFALPYEPGGMLLAGLAGIAGLAALAVPPNRAWRPAAMAVLLICLGALFGKVETWRLGTTMLGGEVATRATGRIVALDRLANGRARLTIDVQATERPTLRHMPRRIRATARRLPDGARVGSVVSGLVRLRPPSGPVRPGSYDFSFESYFDGIGASGFFMSGPELAAPGPARATDRFAAALENARDAVAARVRERIGGAQGEIAAALMVGVRAGIPEEVSEALRRTGLYHVISISGLHMALVAGVVIGALRAGMALFPGFASRRPVKKYAAAAGLVAIAAYLTISGGEVAAQRSFLMLAVMLAALLFDRAALTMRNLAISAIIVLVATPHEVVGPSFQMSFAATAALVAAYAWWAERRKNQMPLWSGHHPFAVSAFRWTAGVAAGLLVTSLVAGLATTAYGAYHFQRVAPLSLAANLVAMPIVSVVVMPSAVLAAAAMPFGLEGPFLDLMGKGIAAMMAVADWFSRRSPVDAVGLISGRSVVLVTLALIIATVASTWLRLAALPFALAGLLTIDSVRAPDVLVSEDGTLVGFLTAQGDLAVNRTRPNAFTAANWQRALQGAAIRKPRKDARPAKAAQAGDGSMQEPDGGVFADPAATTGAIEHPATGGPDIASLADEVAGPSEAGQDGFLCGAAGCAARHPSGAIIVHTADAEEARQACGFAGIIVLEDAATPLTCADRAVVMVTRRALARSGSAAIELAARSGSPQIRFAIGGPQRPWHGHRVFSREARGLPPYRRENREKKTAKIVLPVTKSSGGSNSNGEPIRSAPGGAREHEPQ